MGCRRKLCGGRSETGQETLVDFYDVGSCQMTARSIRFCSSRTLPGHEDSATRAMERCPSFRSGRFSASWSLMSVHKGLFVFLHQAARLTDTARSILSPHNED